MIKRKMFVSQLDEEVANKYGSKFKVSKSKYVECEIPLWLYYANGVHVATYNCDTKQGWHFDKSDDFIANKLNKGVLL